VASERFLDANIFIRHFAADHATHSPAATALFDRLAAKQEAGWTSHLVMAEVAWVLTGPTYGFSREIVAQGLAAFVAARVVRMEAADAILETLNLFATSNLGFMDSYNAVLVRRQPVPELYSFDRGFDRVSGITRIEPGRRGP
jgi:predicted nucleic acid-binding protein